MDYKQAAKEFCEKETQFHLGVIPTEQSNPITKNLSATIAKDTAAGVKCILDADVNISKVARETFKSKAYKALVDDIVRCMDEGKTVLFSSVGASGRMAIQLDATWRKYFLNLTQVLPKYRYEFLKLMEVTNSLTTGGDRALVQAVENFEDYMTFGARQIEEAGVGKGDVVVALSECGLSASINGSAVEADKRGCNTYYLYCNPKEILTEHLERSRKVFERENIVFMPLYVGNMAVAGSTRMQVTTIELLVAGAALEMAADIWLKKTLTEEEYACLGTVSLTGDGYADAFEELSKNLRMGEALSGLAQAVAIEADTYTKGGLISYATHEYLLDIMTDTTERQPTFTLPPFRKKGETGPLSWAYIKDPLYPSDVAWQHVFLRPVKGLDWNKEDYIQMKAADDIINNPPKVGGEEVFKYDIGSSSDPSRWEKRPAGLVLVDINGSFNKKAQEWANKESKNFDFVTAFRFGDIPYHSISENEVKVPVKLPRTSMELLTHLMVKLAFNVLSTATMAKMGRVWGNWMIQVLPTNKKLIDRSTRIIANLMDIPYEKACEEFFKSYYSREEGQQYRESYVVETLNRLGFDPKEER
jgi:N-acetylmuramic acid 6-phosphate etherase